MPPVRELTADDARGLAALYEDYEWWEDREIQDIRTALQETEVAIGIEETAGDDGPDLVAAARILTDYTLLRARVRRDRRQRPPARGLR